MTRLKADSRSVGQIPEQSIGFFGNEEPMAVLLLPVVLTLSALNPMAVFRPWC